MIAYYGRTYDAMNNEQTYEGTLEELMGACELHESAIIFDIDQHIPQHTEIPYDKTCATWVEGRGWKDFEGGIDLVSIPSWLGLGQTLWS